jgi:hypothetical protein
MIVIITSEEAMEQEEGFEERKEGKRVKVRVVTNRSVQFITALPPGATVSDLANRALSVYLELAGSLLPGTTRKQLTVSAVKQGVFYMPKSEYVANLLANDDQVEVVIVKAKPKYPHQLFQDASLHPKNKSAVPPNPASQPAHHPISPEPLPPTSLPLAEELPRASSTDIKAR